jgi:hypothetical protein
MASLRVRDPVGDAGLKRVIQAGDIDPARIRELMLANLFAVFDERDPNRRLDVIARNYAEDVIWSDPDGTFQGHEAMNEQAQKLIDRMPDFVFSAAGPVHVSRDLGLLSFNLGVPKQPPAVTGSTWPWCAIDESPCCTRS